MGYIFSKLLMWFFQTTVQAYNSTDCVETKVLDDVITSKTVQKPCTTASVN